MYDFFLIRTSNLNMIRFLALATILFSGAEMFAQLLVGIIGWNI